MPNIDGNGFQPVVGGFTSTTTDAVLFYRRGSASERFISFGTDGSVNDLEPPVVNGSYDPTVGDFDGNGYGDIAWTSGGKATIWKFNSGGYTQTSVSTNTTNPIGRTIANYLFPA